MTNFRFEAGHAKTVKSFGENRQLTSFISAAKIHAVLKARNISKCAETKSIPVFGGLLVRA